MPFKLNRCPVLYATITYDFYAIQYLGTISSRTWSNGVGCGDDSTGGIFHSDATADEPAQRIMRTLFAMGRTFQYSSHNSNA
jgi:hypothetical protein